MADIELWITDDAGRRIAPIKNAAFMSMSRTLQGFGTFHTGIPFKDYNVSPIFLPDRRVEVWRSPGHGHPLRREGSFFLRKFNVYTRESDNLEIIEFFGRSPLDILRRQAVTSTTASVYSKTDQIDDMMKAIVTDNFITTPQTAPVGELTVDGNEALGPSISHSFFGKNVLDILKDLKDISFSMNRTLSTDRRIFFDVVEGAPLSGGGFGYIFRTYADLRGVDRTINGPIFSVENGNIKDPSYYEDYLDSATLASVLNFDLPASNGSATSPDRYLSRWNDIRVAQTTSDPTVAINNSEARQLLQEHAVDKALNVNFVDSPGSDRQPRSLYGIDWDLGDLLPVRFARRDFNTEVQIIYLSVNEDGQENIIGMSQVQ